MVVVVLFLAGVSANVNDLPHRGPCNRGGGAAGKCIDLNSFACSTTPLVGKCPGAKNIRCCQGVVSNKNSGGEVSEAPGPTPAVNEAPPSTTLQPTSTGEVQSAPPSTPNTNLNPGVAYDDDPGNSYRVRRDTYGSLPRNSPLLVAVPSSGGQRKLHTLCAARFNAMRAAALEAGFDFKVASGWREHRFQESEEVYCAAMRQRYPDLSCRQARSRIAFKSPHETGLALDLGSPSPFRPSFTHKDAQLRSPAFAWLKQNAHRFGITPYKHEPWHWECVLTVDAYRTGVEFTDDYNVRVAQ